jgi:hypothetical protein
MFHPLAGPSFICCIKHIMGRVDANIDICDENGISQFRKNNEQPELRLPVISLALAARCPHKHCGSVQGDGFVPSLDAD